MTKQNQIIQSLIASIKEDVQKQVANEAKNTGEYLTQELFKVLKKAGLIIGIQGKDYILHSGLTYLMNHYFPAYSMQCKMIHFNPNENYKGVIYKCTCSAPMIGAKAVIDGQVVEDIKVTTAHGDASPNNVGSRVRSSMLRVGETRAKNRAMRDFLSINMCSFEELDDSAFDQQNKSR